MNISHGTDSILDCDSTKQYLNKIVRYKEYSPKNGTVTRDYDFLIVRPLIDFKGVSILMGLTIDRETGLQVSSFERPIHSRDVYLVNNNRQDRSAI